MDISSHKMIVELKPLKYLDSGSLYELLIFGTVEYTQEETRSYRMWVRVRRQCVAFAWKPGYELVGAGLTPAPTVMRAELFGA